MKGGKREKICSQEGELESLNKEMVSKSKL